jgi:hypothetical protein
MAITIPKNPTAADYDRVVKEVRAGVRRGDYPLKAAKQFLDAIEDRKEELLVDLATFDEKKNEAQARGVKNYQQKHEKLVGTYFKLLIDGVSNGTIDPKNAEKANKEAKSLLKKATDQLQQDTPSQVTAMLTRDAAGIAAFAADKGFDASGPEVDPTNVSIISPNVKGVSRAAKHVVNELGFDPSFLDRDLTDEEYESWNRLSANNEASDWFDSIELDESNVPEGLYDKLGLSQDQADGFNSFILGALRENLQNKALRRQVEDTEQIYKRASDGEEIDPEDIARQRTIASSLARTSLAMEDPPQTIESSIALEVQGLASDPRLQYSYEGPIDDREQKLAFAKTVALKEDADVALSLLEASGDLLEAGFDDQGRPIYDRRKKSREETNPFIQPMLDRIQMTKDVTTSSRFYAIADSLGMNLAKGEQPTVGQLKRVLREVQRDKRRPYQPTSTYVEVDVVDRDRALETRDGQFLSFVDESTGDFISLEEMRRRSEQDLQDKDANPVVEISLNDKGVREIMAMSLDEESADKVRQINNLYRVNPTKAADSSVLVDLKKNEVVIVGPDRQVFFRGNIKGDQAAAINDAAKNINIASVASDPAGVRAGDFGNSLQSLDGLSIGDRYNANLYSPSGTKVSTETPTRTVKGFAARQKYAGDQSRFVITGADRQGEQIRYSDVRGEMTSTRDLTAEDAAARMGISPGKARRLTRRGDRARSRARSEFKRGVGDFTSEPIARQKTPMQKALTPPPMMDADVEATLPDKSDQVATPEAAPPAAVPAVSPPDAAPTVAPPVVPPPASAPALTSTQPGSSKPPKASGESVPKSARVFPPLAGPESQEDLVKMGRIPGSAYDVPSGRAVFEALNSVKEEKEDDEEEAAPPVVEEKIVGKIPGASRRR